MGELEDVLADIDPDQAEVIKAALKKQQDAAAKAQTEASLSKRELRFKNDDDLLKNFPRVVTAVREGVLDTSGVAEDKLDEWLKTEEGRLTALRVPNPLEGQQPPSSPEQPEEKPAGNQWGGAVSPSGTGGTTATHANDVIDAMETGNISDVLSAIHKAADENPAYRGEGAFLKVVEPYQSRKPIL